MGEIQREIRLQSNLAPTLSMIIKMKGLSTIINIKGASTQPDKTLDKSPFTPIFSHACTLSWKRSLWRIFTQRRAGSRALLPVIKGHPERIYGYNCMEIR